MFEQQYSNEPIYIQVKETLLKRIKEGIYQKGKLIPSENELTNEFNASRVTIRKSLSILEDEGYIERKRGYGTVVTYSGNDLYKFTLLKSFTSEMKENGKPVVTLESELKTIQALGELSIIFSCTPDKDLYQLKRVRGDSFNSVVVSVTVLDLEIELPSTPTLLYGSLYAYLMSKGITFSKMREIISSTLPSIEVAEKLAISTNEPVLKRERYSYDDTGTLREYTINYYNSKKYKYTIDINN